VSARRGHADAILRKTGSPGLQGVGFGQMEKIFAGTTGRDKKRGRESGLKKFASDIFSDFVTGRPDARPHRRNKIRRLNMESIRHDSDGFFHDPRPRTAPTGMNGGNDPPPRVGKKQRKTIRRFYNEKETGFLRNQSIALKTLGRFFLDNMHDIGVDLAKEDGLKTPLRRKNPKIVLRERPGPETMDDPGERGDARIGRYFFHIPVIITDSGCPFSFPPIFKLTLSPGRV